MVERSASRAASLQAELLEVVDEPRRARIHLELGRLALRDGRLEVAVRHLREALLLDGRMESARQLLADLGEGSRIVKRSRGRRAAMRGLLGRVRKGR